LLPSAHSFRNARSARTLFDALQQNAGALDGALVLAHNLSTPMRLHPMTVFAMVGLLFIVLARPLIRRRVPPNGLYGVRIPATLADESVWYAVNAQSGRDLRLLGAVVVVLALAVWALGWPVSRQLLVLLAALTSGTLVVVVRAFRHANRLRRER
jgi:uncharacterized membrane protein